MFEALNCNNVNIKRVTGFDKYNEATGTVKNIKCKLEFKFKKITNSKGAEVVSEGQLRCSEPIGKDDMVEINGKFRPFIQIQPQDNFKGQIVYWIGWF